MGTRETGFRPNPISDRMVEQTERTGGDGGPRSANGRRFEVFVREDELEPLEHVGTVAAPTPDAAHEEASRLFAWYARDVWVCPAAETYRYSAESLADDGDPESTPTPDPADDADADATPDAEPEPRVYEETEGTPTVACGGTPVDGDSDERGPRAADADEGDGPR